MLIQAQSCSKRYSTASFQAFVKLKTHRREDAYYSFVVAAGFMQIPYLVCEERRQGCSCIPSMQTLQGPIIRVVTPNLPSVRHIGVRCSKSGVIQCDEGFDVLQLSTGR